MTKKLVIFGAGQIAELAGFYFDHDSDYDVAAYCVDATYIADGQSEFMERPLYSFEEIEHHCPASEHEAFVALSYNQMNDLRAQKLAAMKEKGYEIASYVSSKATIFPDFKCGENCFILEDNTIQPFVTIGDNVVLWSGNHIGHHASIGDHCFITSHVVVSGGVEIGCNSFIGVNATLRNHIKIGERVVIGAGAAIMKDAPDNSVWKGASSEMAKITSDKIKL